MDWAEAYRILGVTDSATEAEIKEQYIYKAQLLHPDKNQDKPEYIRKKAETELALINQAYAFLSNPGNNPYKIPPELSIEPIGIRFKDVIIGERKSTTIMIKNVGGPYTSIWIDNKPAPWLTVIGVKSIGNERLPLEVTLEGTGIGESGKEYFCNLIIKLENETSHTVDQATVKIEMFIKPGLPVSGKNTESKTFAGPVSQSKSNSRLGLGIGAFILNFIAFAALGAVAVYVIYNLLTIDQTVLIIGSIIYALITFGISFNHALSISSKDRPIKTRHKKQ
jgi:hypothetical protein